MSTVLPNCIGGTLLQTTSLDPTTRWVVIALAVLTICYAMLRPLFKRRDPLERHATPSLAQQRVVEREMSNLLVELSEMTRQLNAQLDTRAAKLEQLIRDADERIALMRTIQGSAIATSADQVAHPGEPPEVDPQHAKVYALADQGTPLQEIAQRVGLLIGEIQLILALRSSQG